MIDVTRRRELEERKFTVQQTVLLSHWIYTSIPKGEDHQTMSMHDFYKMYGLMDDKDLESSFEDKLKARDEEIKLAYRSVSSCGIPMPEQYKE